MATSTAQAVATVPVYDYALAPGDPTSSTPKGLLGKRVKVTLDYSQATSQNPVTALEGASVITQTDGNGFWQVNVVATDKINPSGVLYQVEVEGRPAYLINPVAAGVPGVGWQSSAIVVNAPTGTGVAGFFLPGGTTVLGGLNITAGEPGFDVAAAGTLLIGDNVATGIEMGAPTAFAKGPVYDVSAYGTFTGVDDTTTLLAVVAATPANSIIWIPQDPSGNPWVTTATLQVASLTNVWFDGPGTIKLKNTSNVPVIRFQNCTGGGVRNITIDGNKANNIAPGALGNSGVFVGNTASPSTQVNVIGARILNCFGDGIYVLNSTRCRAEGNYVTGCGTTTNGGTPIHFLQGANDGEIIGNICDANGYGIYVEANATTSTQRTRIALNMVSNCFGTNAALAQAAGIALAGAPYSIVEGNHSYNHASMRGIVLFPGGAAFPSDFSELSGNTCTGNGHNGIDITGNFLRCVGNHAEVNAQSGIFLSGDLTPVDASWCVIAYNICRNNGTAGGGGGTLTQAGIVLNTVVGANITDNLIEGNICTDNGTGNQKYGILEWQANASYLRNTYQGNSVRGNATIGISLLGTTNTVRDNQGFNPHIRQAPAFAASFTPDLTLGDYIAIGALTANITVNAFAAGQLYPGQIVTLQFTEDATGGRTITWNALYKTAWQPAQAASAVSTISFEYDGTSLQQIGGQIAVDQTSGLGYLPQDLHILQGTHGVINDGGSLLLGAPSTSSGYLFNVTGQGNKAIISPTGQIEAFLQMYPGAEAGALQTTGGFLHSTGVPSNANGNNNDWAISDNGRLYFKVAGAWNTPSTTLKKGSGGGNYTSASTTYVDVDATNLALTITIPTNWKLVINASGQLSSSTAIATVSVSLLDTSTLVEAQVNPTVAGTAGAEDWSLNWVINGDAASHTVKLQYKTSNGADSALMLNSSATLVPTMVFTLMPSS